ncbi:hypothetical protein QTP86_007058, partial [Hemibagrus guttatus]
GVCEECSGGGESDWETTAEVIRETGRKVLGVSSGRRKEDKETWWWNEEVQDSIQRKRLAKKKWDMDRTEENRQEYKELQRRVKREVSKAKQKAYDELYTRLDTREGEKDLYRLARQRDRDGKDVQQVRVIKDRDGRVLTSEESVQRRWKEYFEELMNEENEREKRVEGVNSVEQKVDKIRKDEVRKALKRMKSGKAVGPDDIPVEVWKCLGEAAVEFLTSLFNRVLENLEKAYDRVPREELWYCMRNSGVAEKYVRVVQDMYERSRTVVRCAVVMDQFSEEVRQEPPWTMMFADDIVICSESREQVEENLERWRFALERRGMKVSGSKTEYMCVNGMEGSGTVRLQGEEVKKVQEFKYLGSTVQSNGECGKEVKKRVQAGWNGWRKVWGVLCDRKISARIKGKVYRTVVRAAMLYGLETVSLRKRQESELEVAELKMLSAKRLTTNSFTGNSFTTKPFNTNPFTTYLFNTNPFTINPFNTNPFITNPFNTNPFNINPFNTNPFTTNPFNTNPFTINPFNTNPFTTNPFNTNPFTTNPFNTNPFTTNPFNTNPFTINPLNTNPFITNLFNINPFTTNLFNTNPFTTNLFNTNPFTTNLSNTNPLITNLFSTNTFTTNLFITSMLHDTSSPHDHLTSLKSTNFIPDRSRPGLTTTAIGAVDLQGAGGNWATVGRRSRGGRRVRRQREKRKGKSVGLRIRTLNVGTMTGKGRELADMMERRKVDILCVQETRWKGSKACSIGAGFKLFYYGVDSKRNGVGVVLKEEFVRNVLEVKRVSDRVMSLKLEIEGVMLNVVRGYAPQVGCELEEKERFWSELDEVMESIPTGERVVIGADFNGHVGEGNTGDEEVMGKFGVKERNLEGQMVVDFAKRMDMAVVNTYFQKREEHRVTYKSGGRRTQKLRQALGGQVVLPDDWETTAEVIRETGRKVLGVSSGRRKEDKETWWWNEEVQDSIQRKRLAKKKWDMDRTEENRQEYKELQRRVKREVSKAKQKAYDELYTRLDTREGEKDLYRLSRQRDRDGKDVQQVRVIKDRDGRVLTSEESVQRRWKEYFEELMNEENEREKRVEGVNSVEQKVDKIRKDEVRKALKRMKSGKAVGPDDIPVEVWKCLGEAAVEFLANLFNRVLESERMPEEWRRSVLVPIFKNKGDVQSCSNYRGIKLMSHTMKLWERVVEARLRKVVEICEQQYGFMPRKSTTDAIFALRILMEKYRDGQKELHCVFVDLEKAYDRVPREELWYCMRKSGVAEKYVRVVQDMYERSRTVVRCAVGQTEEFNVEVGLHQGSALSPFLLAIVMDQLSEEVRQESPWTMMFADDIVICSESREQVEENLERWRFALERRGMKVSRSKTEYMCVNEREGSGTVRLQGEEVKKVQEFKYLGSTVQSNGECGKEVKKRVQAGWNGWRKVSGVLCDQKISARIKGKVYRTVVRPAMLYGLETVSLRKRQESELEVAELKMLRFFMSVTRLDRIRNEYIRGTAHVGRLGDKVRETRLRWFGHVQRRDSLVYDRIPPYRPVAVCREEPSKRLSAAHRRPLETWRKNLPDAAVDITYSIQIKCGDELQEQASGSSFMKEIQEQASGTSFSEAVQEQGSGTSFSEAVQEQGKGRELADVMERRKVDILCVQETRWKGSKARSIGAGFKLFYYGVDSKRNGVGVVLKEEFVRNVLEVKRVSDRVMSLKLEIEGVMLNVVSGYAPQVGCELEEKERFWSELDEVMESIPTGERVVIGADFNGHVGEGNTGDEEVMGKFGVKERNLEGQMVVDFAKRMNMGVVNTYFQKREEHRVTYKSGGRRTQVDYILCRRGNLKEISDCKVVVGESVARQHRMVVCRMTLMVCKKKRSETEKKTKWWKLKKEECCEEFRQKLRQALGGQVVLPDDWETTAEVIRETGRKVLGVSSRRRKEDKETWWWNEEVQDSVQRKRLAKKKWDMDRTEENRQEYKELQRRVKREVSKAKQKAYEELYTRLDTREGEKDLYKLARQRDRDGKDVQQVRFIKDRDGRVLTSEQSVQRRWKEYFEELMNEENEREKRVEGVNSVEQKVDNIRKDEVRKALKRMKSGKAVGPDDIPVEVWKCLGEAAVEFLANLFNRVLESERMPEEWRRSVLVPIFKNKGDVQSCSNYRGIKLMSHTMKVWERVVEARLRKVVEICEQQYGFMPRKSTTDAIFALRILMEKYRDGQRELHCVFVDLEKAYDRVPREELWYCMRKSGVAEKYVRVVQDMYERSRTVVRCAVGQTEEFNVEVGLHQGSALSPFLFAMVMDQLSEEVRQESPWTMMFADDIVICSESREQVEENLERWRFALERRGMKVSRSKTEYMCVNEREGSGTVRLQGEEVKKVQEFKYLGSTVQSNGECGKEVKKRVQAGWNGWRKVSGVLCDQKISARIKGKVYRTVVRAAMLYGLETVSLRKRQESELEVAELKMLRFSLGVTRLDRIRNEYIRGTAHVGRLGDKVREARLRWFGHVQRREISHDLLIMWYGDLIRFSSDELSVTAAGAEDEVSVRKL